jgi:putative transposase
VQLFEKKEGVVMDNANYGAGIYGNSYYRARHKISYEGAITHVTQHATGTEPLFREESDYLRMLYLIKKICEDFNLSMLSFVLMINHLHLLIRMNAPNLSQAMKKLFETYAKYFNKKYQRRGHVFSGAYRSTLCVEENHPLAASLYIHRNPVEAGLVSNPEDYRWSTCALFVKNIDKKTFVDVNFILDTLNSNTLESPGEYKILLGKASAVKIGKLSEQSKALESIMDIVNESNDRWKQVSNLLMNKNAERIIEKLKNKNRITGPHDIEEIKFLVTQLKSRGFSAVKIAKKLNKSRRSIYNFLR